MTYIFRDNAIVFQWTDAKWGALEKIVVFSIIEGNHYIPNRERAIWQGVGEMTIKEAMGLPESACCCNPHHECIGIEYGRRISREAHPEIGEVVPPTEEEKKAINTIPQRKKFNVGEEKVDARKKLSDHDIAIIRQSSHGPTQLAKQFGVSVSSIVKYRNGERR